MVFGAVTYLFIYKRVYSLSGSIRGSQFSFKRQGNIEASVFFFLQYHARNNNFVLLIKHRQSYSVSILP